MFLYFQSIPPCSQPGTLGAAARVRALKIFLIFFFFFALALARKHHCPIGNFDTILRCFETTRILL